MAWIIRTCKQSDFVTTGGCGAAGDDFCFPARCADHIRYGRPDASDDEVIAAAKAAQAHDFILHLPNGYIDTRVEERGVNLSGGQKQRIAIARAILLRPAVLILDDSTSSVDVETETRIQNAMKDWMKDSTSFVVAQRISTVLNADKIIVVDEGQIVAQGTHARIDAKVRSIREIYASQLGDGVKMEGAGMSNENFKERPASMDVPQNAGAWRHAAGQIERHTIPGAR
jgi:ATP-binding cassette subfamily B protein